MTTENIQKALEGDHSWEISQEEIKAAKAAGLAVHVEIDWTNYHSSGGSWSYLD